MTFSSNSLRELAQQQHNLLTREQLAECGFSSRKIATRIERQEWQAVTRRIIAVQPQPLSRTQEIWTPTLHFDDALLVGEAVLELAGLPRNERARIDVVVSRTGKRPPFLHWKLHTPAELPAPASLTPRQVDFATAAAFAAGTAGSDKQGSFFVIWAIQQGLATLEQIQHATELNARSRESAAARRRIALVDPGVHSSWEQTFLKICRRNGLPKPKLQEMRLDSSGKRRYLDATFKCARGSVVVEIDGAGHLAVAQQIDDALKSNEMLMQNLAIIRIPGIALRVDPGPFVRQIRQAIAEKS